MNNLSINDTLTRQELIANNKINRKGATTRKSLCEKNWSAIGLFNGLKRLPKRQKI